MDLDGVFIPPALMVEYFAGTLTMEEILFLVVVGRHGGATEAECRTLFRKLHWTNKKGFAVVRGLKGKGYGNVL